MYNHTIKIILFLWCSWERVREEAALSSGGTAADTFESLARWQHWQAVSGWVLPFRPSALAQTPHRYH